MGMIVTLYLISANVYNSVNAPSGRGFSYIEIWIIGAQFPILLALCEYGIILYYKKVEKKPGVNKIQPMNPCDAKVNLDDWIKKMDFATMIFSLVSFLVFSSLYWIIALM